MSDNQKLSIPEDDGAAKYLERTSIPNISLPNQEGHLLSLHR